MKYIISENRLSEVFRKFMDSQYDLTMDRITRQLISNDGEIFGDVVRGHFYYYDGGTEFYLTQMFGKDVNRLLINYLRNKFPGLDVHSYVFGFS